MTRPLFDSISRNNDKAVPPLGPIRGPKTRDSRRMQVDRWCNFWYLLWRGPAGDEVWERPALVVLMATTALLYLSGLDANGWANPYYSAAAQAGAQDWKAFFFGSSEWGNLITVDKTPLSIWVMSLSVRIFGLSSWSLLTPQALIGVTTSYLIYRVLRSGFGPRTALFGAAVYATTPVVFLMSRYNNPEPVMGLLTVASVWATLKAMETAKLRTFAFAGLFLGLGFMAKQVQALLVAPALFAAVLAFSRGKMTQRIRQLCIAALAAVSTAGAWIAIVDLIPNSDRPYVGGSMNNSALELTLDYNGLARFIHIPITAQGGRASEQATAAREAGGFGRLFNANFAPEIVWLLFAGMVCCALLVVLSRTLKLSVWQRNITSVACAWFATALLVLCVMGTMIHTYYTYSLGPPLAMVLAIGLSSLWRLRNRTVMRLIGAILIGSSAYISLRVMEYSDHWPLWLKTVVAIAGLVAAGLWMAPTSKEGIPMSTALVIAGSLMVGPMGTNLFTLATPQTGTNPQSGPVGNDESSMSKRMQAIKAGEPPWAQQIALGAAPPTSVTFLLRSEAPEQQWAAATYSAQNAALYQLESGRPVIPLGGWLGTDPAPTLERFQALVAEHRIGYFIWQQALLDRGELSQETIAITGWVRTNFTEQIVDGVSLYDLRK